MVSPYPPYRDGIGSYAVQEVAALRRDGHDVEVLSPLPSAAHHHLPLPSPRSMLALADMAKGYDRVIVQFHPDLFFEQWWGPAPRQAVWAGFALLASRTELELRLHEIDYRSSRVRGALRRFALRHAASVVVHTEIERRRCIDELGLPADKVRLVDHGSSFTARTSLSRAEARDELGLPADAPVFVSIGFIQPHKGFDRAVRAFGRLDAPAEGPPPRLYVVGDVRLDEPAWLAHCDELAALIDRTPGAELRRGYVSDERFDLWIAAADRVVLPYRHIWSSSVVERAALLGTPTIVTAVGGLGHQAASGGVVVEDDEQLAEAMAAAAGVALRPVRRSGGGDVPGREELQARIAGAVLPVPSAAVPVERDRPLAVRRLSLTPRPEPRSANPLNARLKRVVQRTARWMVDPVADHLDLTVRSVSADVEALDQRLRALEDRSCQGSGASEPRNADKNAEG
jgi:glycosyltransferase involved in cell wall biosynthesis